MNRFTQFIIFAALAMAAVVSVFCVLAFKMKGATK
jgi:hypothetical protein